MFLSWLDKFEFNSKKAKSSKAPFQRGFVFFFGSRDRLAIEKIIREKALSWQSEALLKQDREFIYFVGKDGPYWIVTPSQAREEGTRGVFGESDYSWARDTLGALLGHLKAHHIDVVEMQFVDTSREQELGAFIGFELAAYSFRTTAEGKKVDFPRVHFQKTSGPWNPDHITEARKRAQAVNWARHLVNMPPNEVNPVSLSRLVKEMGWSKNTKIEIWDEKRLKREGMGLHLGVGQGSETPPRLVHLAYRPTGAKRIKAPPIAFVGKGITFDTGGLDIKPSAGMRLMKKDMGGAAALVGLAHWVDQAKLPMACDFYLALAENAVDAKAFRPSDILTARNGLRVEIDNTDAEGRLVLADALDVATTQKGSNEPQLVIDVATLTGAIKIGLGADVAGLFSNDDELAEELMSCGWKAGDWNWRMPLVDRYNGLLSSPFADCKNSTEGFGGAITASLFLQKFVRGKKWAHLDIYAWCDKAQGPLTTGGSGQSVQMLIKFLESKAQ